MVSPQTHLISDVMSTKDYVCCPQCGEVAWRDHSEDSFEAYCPVCEWQGLIAGWSLEGPLVAIGLEALFRVHNQELRMIGVSERDRKGWLNSPLGMFMLPADVVLAMQAGVKFIPFQFTPQHPQGRRLTPILKH